MPYVQATTCPAMDDISNKSMLISRPLVANPAPNVASNFYSHGAVANACINVTIQHYPNVPQPQYSCDVVQGMDEVQTSTAKGSGKKNEISTHICNAFHQGPDTTL